MTPTLPLDETRDELSAYAYSYPHKSSYHALDPPIPIGTAWQGEEVDRLSLYVHIPFCEFRCGFCNLFTQSQPGDDVVAGYLATLHRQMTVVRDSIPHARFQQVAIGGGTPTHLSARQLEQLLSGLEACFGLSIAQSPTSVEASPATATSDRLKVLKAFGVERLSLGVQSFVEEERRWIGRPHDVDRTQRVIDTVRQLGFPVLNLDLIYGDPRQTPATWRTNLLAALRHHPEELYLYPLYVRPETGLARLGRSAAEHRRDLYRLARDLLFSEGYEQTSLRCFRRPRPAAVSAYACQRDGMIGLGCGARSYTRRLHYATRFAVTQAGVRAILQDWTAQTDHELSLATHGFVLSGEEQRRRYAIMSLLQADGLRLSEYEAQFRSSPHDDLPELEQLASRGWLLEEPDRLVLTADGLERSDEVGPLLYSEPVRSRLREFTRL